MNYSTNQFRAHFTQLPEELQRTIMDPDAFERLEELNERYELSEEQAQTLGSRTGRVLMGLIPRKKFAKVLAKDAEMSGNTAERIAQQVDDTIFEPVAHLIEQAREMSVPSEEDAAQMLAAPEQEETSDAKQAEPSTPPQDTGESAARSSTDEDARHEEADDEAKETGDSERKAQAEEALSIGVKSEAEPEAGESEESSEGGDGQSERERARDALLETQEDQTSSAAQEESTEESGSREATKDSGASEASQDEVGSQGAMQQRSAGQRDTAAQQERSAEELVEHPERAGSKEDLIANQRIEGFDSYDEDERHYQDLDKDELLREVENPEPAGEQSTPETNDPERRYEGDDPYREPVE